jgi:hypothetical protein
MHHTKLEDHKNSVTTSKKGNKFKFTSPIPGVHIYDNVWPESMDFINKIDSDNFWETEASPEDDVKWIREDYLDQDHGKKSKTCWIQHHPEISNAFEEVVDSYLAHWNLEPHSIESMRITKFEGPGEFFGMHSDDSFATPRTTSMVYYPTDSYEGGELDFIHFGVKIKPKANQLFLFPSAYNLEHKVHPVISGTRITFVSFFNQMTFQERSARQNLLNPNEYYQPKVPYVFEKKFLGYN